MVVVDGLLEPEAGQTLLAALEPLARPADATDTRSGSQRRADALAELARRAPEGGRLPQTGGIRPQLNMGLGRRLLAAMALLPPTLGGTPSQPLDVGRATRVVQPAQRTALAVRDGGCVFPGCDRPPPRYEAHHLVHWLHGGPTDLANLALSCRAHHRAVHEGGWRLQRQPDGRFTTTPPHRHPRAAA